MAIFFDHEVQLPGGGAYRPDVLKWHTKQAVLAVGTYSPNVGGEVNLFLEEVVFYSPSRHFIHNNYILLTCLGRTHKRCSPSKSELQSVLSGLAS